MNPLLSVNPVEIQTRTDLQSLAGELYAPVAARLSPGRARAKLGWNAAGYSIPGMEMEACLRPLWFLAPLVAGGGAGPDPRLLAEGLDHGTNPEHPEYWGEPGDSDQRFVEMAVIGFTLMLTPDLLWKPLSSDARKRVATWLGKINQYELPANNWYFFRIFVNEGLAAVGAPGDSGQIERDFEVIETLYRGDGWYRDGVAGGYDYYNAFAFHYYGLVVAKWISKRDPERSELFKQRAARFAEDFALWFDPSGATVPFGRSLVYRFAMGSFWSAAAYADLPVFSPGILRGLIMRNLRWWFRRPIRDESGLLSLGYAYPNLQTTEAYNSPGSPYWAGKIFLVLGLPSEHPFWCAEEEPLPSLPKIQVQAAGHLLAARSSSGHATLLSAGQNLCWNGRNFASKYNRFAYSSRFGFSVSLDTDSLHGVAPDSSLWVSLDGETWHGRKRATDHDFGKDWVASTWTPVSGVSIRTRLEAFEGGHRRVHEITTEHTVQVVEGGFALPRGPENLANTKANRVPGLKLEIQEGFARMDFADAYSSILDQPAKDALPRRAEMFEPWPNTNLLHPLTALPLLRCELAPGSHTLRCEVRGDVDLSKGL